MTHVTPTELRAFLDRVEAERNQPLGSAPGCFLRECDGMLARVDASMADLESRADAAGMASLMRLALDLGRLRDREQADVISAKAQSDRKFEADERRVQRTASGQADERALALPSLAEYKAAAVSSEPGGGYLAPIATGPFIDRLRANNITLSIPGLRVIPMSADRVELPGIGTSVTAYHVGEGATITESSPAFRSVALQCKKFATRSLASFEWLTDSTDAGFPGREIIAADHRRQLASILDLNFLQGSGNSTSPIVGLRNVSGITATPMGASGAAITLDAVLAAVGRLESANATPTAIICHPTVWTAIRKLQDQYDRYQLQPDPSRDAAKRLFGLDVLASSQISTTETEGGSGAVCSWLAVVDGSALAVGLRQQVTTVYDEFTYASSAQVQIVQWVRAAFAVLHTAGVQLVTGITTS